MFCVSDLFSQTRSCSGTYVCIPTIYTVLFGGSCSPQRMTIVTHLWFAFSWSYNCWVSPRFDLAGSGRAYLLCCLFRVFPLLRGSRGRQEGHFRREHLVADWVGVGRAEAILSQHDAKWDFGKLRRTSIKRLSTPSWGIKEHEIG